MPTPRITPAEAAALGIESKSRYEFVINLIVSGQGGVCADRSCPPLGRRNRKQAIRRVESRTHSRSAHQHHHPQTGCDARLVVVNQ
jgi:hypothetical protein